ncbi:chromate transporter [Evansella cellulosilytica]|uniref:Chromate transporter n=1 Tax=Evansella cellulosilytica (strain ATCC 21833 / DSM 2522 / FERM P-1141 / JCM 9156 / N-4) TaxID=649639 RepID=E6TSK0_EVAC2|nr:chromate transporter [Evansella cellulosilytica]ADU29508.1 Chromate transporter [Evansella cellulosilytica DSM 2522]
MKVQWELFVAFFRSGILGFGGGPSAIPLVKKEVVDIFKWMNEDEFSDVLALGNALPGPINTKIAGYIGYRVGGYIGLITAVCASIVPSILLMILFLTTLAVYKDEPWVGGMTNGVIPVVTIMLAVLTWEFFKNAKKGIGWKLSISILTISFLLVELLHVHPAVIIGLLLVYVIVKREKTDKKNIAGRA